MGSGLCSRENDRSQLQGSGGFSPRFPNIPPAKCFTVQPQTSILRGQSHCDKLKTKSHPSHRNSSTLKERRYRPEQQKQKYKSCGRTQTPFTSSLSRKNRHRHSLRGSIRIDVNLVGLLARASPDRSNLPSASMHQWRAHLNPLRLQWRGRSGVKPDSHTTPSYKFYTGREGASQILVEDLRHPGTFNRRASSSALPKTSTNFAPRRIGSSLKPSVRFADGFDKSHSRCFQKTMTAAPSGRCGNNSIEPFIAPLDRRAFDPERQESRLKSPRSNKHAPTRSAGFHAEKRGPFSGQAPLLCPVGDLR
jgi:hypothetical protein